MHEALLWETEGDKVRCRMCPHRCLIAEGKHGVCTVRENVGGKLQALTYGRVSSAAVDPIEKKPVFHYRPGTLAFSIGSVGCNMRCGHCQNWQISRETAEHGMPGLQQLEPSAVAGLAKKYGCAGVAYTYNEPTIWGEYVLDTARACKDAGLYNVMVTNGFVTPDGLDLIGDVIDVWRVDVKGFDDSTYRDLCRVPSIGPVLEQTERAKRTWGMHVEVVTNVVPTVNDSDETLHGIARWIRDRLGADTPWHITRFFPYLEFSHLEPTPLVTLRHARDIGAEEGLDFVYLGNVAEPGGEDTYCPQCRAAVIQRDGFRVEQRKTLDGMCAQCGTVLNVTE